MPHVTETPGTVEAKAPRIPHGALVAGLFGLFLLLAVNSLLRDAATFDETAHIPAGYTYLDRGDFRINPEHPPLVKLLAGAAVKASSDAEAVYDRTARDPVDEKTSWEKADQWRFGFAFINGHPLEPERRDPADVLFPARLAMLLPALLLGLVVYGWAREWWGKTGGLVALFLFSLSPTVLAHARLVTTDLPAALGFAGTLYMSWRYARRPGWARGAALGVMLGGALLMKFSAVLLPPILCVLFAGWAFRKPETASGPDTGRRILVGLAGLAGAGLLAWGCIWAGYGFRYAMSPDPGFTPDWEKTQVSEGVSADAIAFARARHLFPESYLYGLAYTLGHADRRLAFLDGEQSVTGWARYFPEAFLLKTPPALMVLLLWLVVAGLYRHPRGTLNGWFVAFPVAVYLLVSMSSNLNIGHRHLAPVYPLLFVFAGGAAGCLVAGPRWRQAIVGLLLASFAISSFLACPRYLSYFNEFGGGARGGWHHFVDSNIDWGQDLPRLKAWMDANPQVPQIYLAYFGTADPDAYGIEYRKVQQYIDFRPTVPSVSPAKGQYLAVSVTFLQGMYMKTDMGFARRALSAGYATNADFEAWVAMKEGRVLAGHKYPSLAEWLVREKVMTESQRIEIEGPLLSSFFRRLREGYEPAARIGDSILVYQIP